MLAGAVTLLLLAGCASATALPERDWRRRANAVCAAWDRDVHALGAARALPAVASITSRSATIGRRRLAQLRRLGPPKRDAKAAAAMFGALDNSLDALANLSRAARTGNRAAVDRAASSLERVQARADRAARKLRLHQCLSNDG